MLEVVEEKNEAAVFSSDSDLFKINWEDIELISELGKGGSGAVVYRGKWFYISFSYFSCGFAWV